jgi:hypothetical protein
MKTCCVTVYSQPKLTFTHMFPVPFVQSLLCLFTRVIYATRVQQMFLHA